MAKPGNVSNASARRPKCSIFTKSGGTLCLDTCIEPPSSSWIQVTSKPINDNPKASTGACAVLLMIRLRGEPWRPPGVQVRCSFGVGIVEFSQEDLINFLPFLGTFLVLNMTQNQSRTAWGRLSAPGIETKQSKHEIQWGYDSCFGPFQSCELYACLYCNPRAWFNPASSATRAVKLWQRDSTGCPTE